MRFLFAIIVSILAFSSNAQDSVVVIDTHSVKKAVILSSCLPGAGQIYNHLAMPKGKKKAFWKVPLIYAGLGTTGYFLVSNQITVNQLKQEYIYRQDNGTFNDPQWSAYDDYGILTLREQYLNYRDLSILAFGIVYIFQIADAGVEAHFVNFDVSDDLSLKLEPKFIAGMNPGIGLSLNFR